MPKYKIVMYGEIEAEDDHKAMDAFLAASPSTKMLLVNRVVIRFGSVGLVEYFTHGPRALNTAFGWKANAARKRAKAMSDAS